MEVVWRCSAKTLEYGISRGESYVGVPERLLAGQPDDTKYVSEGATEIYVRVIEIAARFATIATALARVIVVRT
jgi:hypothetical protein